MAKRYYWLKLMDDFFTSKRIKKLRNLAGGDTYTIIYLKMQLKALKTEGYLYFDGIMKDFAEELALDLDENEDDVRVTINYLASVGLLEMGESDKEYHLTYMDTLIGSESASAQRVRDFRSRTKQDEALQCNTNVTEVKRIGNAEKEIEIEKDIEIDKSKKEIPTRKIIPPEVEWVKAYCEERKNGIDAQRFCDYYEARDWKLKNGKMKDWQAAVRCWEGNQFDDKKKEKKEDHRKQQYDFDAMRKMIEEG